MKKMLVILIFAALTFTVRAGETDDLREELRQLRNALSQDKSATPAPGTVLHAVDTSIKRSWEQNEIDNPVSTRTGKLVIHGLVQVWYHNIQNDQQGWEDAAAILGAVPATFGSNATRDNDTFRVRRAEICFDFTLNDNIGARVKIDPAATPLGYPDVPGNQGTFFNAGFASLNGQGTLGGHCPVGEGVTICNAGIGNVFNPAIRNGCSDETKLLQEAYISYRNICFLPCHDFQIGQMKRRLGEEGVRDNGQLDFAERAMITQVADDYDQGLQVHGSFFDGRLQYWTGVFNGAGTAFQSRSNRTDDNDKKDFLGSILVRPVWEHCFWGSMELGYSGLFGKGGEAANRDPIANPVLGLNRAPTAHSNQYAWLYYAPGADASGLWLRGEWGQYRDRFAPGEVVTGLMNYTNDPAPFKVFGYYGAIGYHLGRSPFANCLPCWARNMEVAYRHEAMENLFYQSVVNTNRGLDVFETRADTFGLNYYLKGHNAKLQLNYNFVREQHERDSGDRQLREVRNDNLVLNFQVAF